MRLPCYLILTLGLAVGLCLATGCQRQIPENEMGRVLDRVPDLPKMDEPYEIKFPNRKAGPPKPEKPWLPGWMQPGSEPAKAPAMPTSGM
jgi:hypothetical protein